MVASIRNHWPEYLMEAAGLGLFMLSAGIFATLIYAPASPVGSRLLHAPFVQAAGMGLAMGLTAAGLIYSPWGQRSGAHLNPAVTMTFWIRGKVASCDALFYCVAQFLGGTAGVFLARLFLGRQFADPPINWVVTIPGTRGASMAFAAELLMSLGMMLTVLVSSNRPGLSRFTGLFAGALVAIYITWEAPLSGMSMNPARTLASALPSKIWDGIWIYVSAPPLGMLLALAAYEWTAQKSHPVLCAKLNHPGAGRCNFLNCGYLSDGGGREMARVPPAVAQVDTNHRGA